MGRSTYYAPLLVGFVLALVLHEWLLKMLPPMPAEQQYLALGAMALAAALLAQFALIGLQGVFAQVLPGPGGRSIRGRGAVTCGFLLLAGLGLAAAGGAVAAEELVRPAYLFLIGSAAALLAALIAYAWAWPTAVVDFSAKD